MTEESLITSYCIVDNFIHRFLETSAEKGILRCITESTDQNSGCLWQMSSH